MLLKERGGLKINVLNKNWNLTGKRKLQNY